MEQFKTVRIAIEDKGTVRFEVYHRVAGVRETEDWLVIRTGAFPDETITKIAKWQVLQYTVYSDPESSAIIQERQGED